MTCKCDNIGNFCKLIVKGWIARDKNGKAYLFTERPSCDDDIWLCGVLSNCVSLKGLNTKHLIRRWNKELIEIDNGKFKVVIQEN